MARSQNGWRVLTRDETQVVTIPGVGIFRFAPGAPAVVLAEYVRRFNGEVEPIAGEVLDDWSWAVRTVRGSTTVISNHASGTAVDLNATRHARGVTGTFTRKQVAAIRRILADLRVIRWGGDFTTVADEMHAEINGSLAEVAEAAERIIAARAQEDDMQLTDRFVLGPTTATLIGKPSVTVAEALSDILGLTKDTNRDVDVAKQALTAAAQRITALQTDVDALRAEVAALKAGS